MSEKLRILLDTFDLEASDVSKVPEHLQRGFDAVLFDKDGTLITRAPEGPPGGDIIEIHSRSMFYRRVQVLPGRIELISELRILEVKLGIVTGDFREPTEELLDKMGVRDAFDTVVAEEDMQIGYKPHPEPFLRARSALRVHPRRCVMIGDSPDDDMAGAKYIGMKTLLVPSYRWGRGWVKTDQIPSSEADVVVLSHQSLTASLIERSFGK